MPAEAQAKLCQQAGDIGRVTPVVDRTMPDSARLLSQRRFLFCPFRYLSLVRVPANPFADGVVLGGIPEH
jgi:hypothetical protein